MLAVRQQPLILSWSNGLTFIIISNPKVYAEHYAARAAACKGHYHIGSLQELPHTIRDPVVPLLVAYYDPW
jgi:hypothetical protein